MTRKASKAKQQSAAASSNSSFQPAMLNVFSVVSALVGSSCCVIQLALNAMEVGCAGFAIFDPLRPVFTAVTLVALSYQNWRFGWKANWKPTLLSVLLLLSPWIVTLVSQEALGTAQLAVSSAFLPLGSTIGFPRAPAKPKVQEIELQWHLKVAGMKCEACGLKVKQTIASALNVSVSIFQKQGRVVVKSTSYQHQDWDSVATTLTETIESMGYTIEVVSQDAFDTL